MNLNQIEEELKKRLNFPYRWEKKESDNWDRDTRIIYKISNFEELQNELQNLELEEKLVNYAVNKWFNFWSAKSIENIFINNTNLAPNLNNYKKLLNFEIDGSVFDHKVFVYPKYFNQPFEYAQENKAELVKWFYSNQGQVPENRRYFDNRIFVVLYDSAESKHWKLKSEVTMLNDAINNYFDSFDPESLVHLNIDGKEVLSDVIWLAR
jgi:hypothetical protein